MQIKTMYFAAVISFIAMSFLTVMSNNSTITPELQEVMLNASNDELIPVGIFLKGQRHFTEAERTSFNDMPKRFRQTFVAREIVSFARDRQKNIMNILKEAETQKKCTRISQIEIVNAINCHLTKDVIETVSKESEINLIIWDKELPIGNTNDAIITASNSFASLKKTATAVDTAAGVKMIHAPDVWGLGYDGDGVLVAVIDQLGFNYNHPDLANHLWDGSSFQYGGDSLNYHGWDYIVGDNNPYYDHGHGTLCAGIIAGDGPGDGTERIKTGVAPGVSLMLLSGNTEAQWFNCLDFFSDMDSIYGANFQMPDIISMSVSQKFPGYPSYGAWRTACEHLLDLGIVHINSAGDTWDGNPGGCNQGIAYEDPVPYNVAAPANCPPPWLHPDQPAPEGENLHLSSAIAVGFVDATGNTIGSNSARGPSAWENIYAIYPCQDNANIYDEMWDYLYDTADQDPNPLIKPDLVGPGGVDIESTSYSSGTYFYDDFQLTSAAAPHVAGTAALMLEANPNLEPADVCRILQLSAIDLGDAGKDTVFGAGRVDALQAVLYTLADEHKSPMLSTTLFNNQRNLARGKNSSNVLYHVFHSGVGDNTEIFFKKSMNGGSTWSDVERLSAGNLGNRYACISVTDEGSHDGLHVIWQRKKSNGNYEIVYRSSSNSGSTWSSPTILPGAGDVSVSTYQRYGPMPVITWATPPSGYRLLVVYASSSGFRWRYKNSSGSWTTPTSDILSAPLGRSQTSAWCPSLMGERNHAALTCDYRSYYGVYSRVYTAVSNSWSSPVSMCNDVFTTIQDRHSQVAIMPNNTVLASWCAQKSGDPYYRILYREGTISNTWSSQYHEFAKIASTTSADLPSLTYFAGNSYDRAITFRGSDTQARYYRRSKTAGTWTTSSHGQNTHNTNITHETGSSIPKMMWADVSSSPYEIEFGSGSLSKANSPDTLLYHRRIAIADKSDLSSLCVEVGQIEAVTSDGKILSLPLVDVPEGELKINSENYMDYLASQPINLPANIEKLRFYQEVYTSVPHDSNSTKPSTKFTSFSVSYSLETTDGSKISADSTYSDEKGWIYSSGIKELDIRSAAGKSVTFKPTLNGVSVPEKDAGFSLGHIWIEPDEKKVEKQNFALSTIPDHFALQQNYPNPFNPETRIKYQIADKVPVTLKIFNALGQEVTTLIDEVKEAGYYEIQWLGQTASGSILPSGVYIYTLQAGNFVESRKLLLLK